MVWSLVHHIVLGCAPMQKNTNKRVSNNNVKSDSESLLSTTQLSTWVQWHNKTNEEESAWVCLERAHQPMCELTVNVNSPTCSEVQCWWWHSAAICLRSAVKHNWLPVSVIKPHFSVNMMDRKLVISTSRWDSILHQVCSSLLYVQFNLLPSLHMTWNILSQISILFECSSDLSHSYLSANCAILRSVWTSWESVQLKMFPRLLTINHSELKGPFVEIVSVRLTVE